MRKYLVRNYISHVADGGFYMIGMALLSATVILPELMKSLNAPPLAIASMPVIMVIGFQISPIFTAHHIERIKRHMPLLIILGLFQRLPYLITGLILWLTRYNPPGWAWILVALTPLVSSLVGGAGFPAWVELVANTIPPKRRTSMSAMRQLIGAFTGIGCGLAVRYILKSYPGCGGIGILHLMCFATLTMSLILFARIKEVPNPRPQVRSKTSLFKALAQMPELLKQAPAVKIYLVEIFLSATPMIMAAFMSIYVLRVLDKPQDYLGTLVSFTMMGNVVANIVSAIVGDKFGPKTLLWISKIALIATCVLMPQANMSWQFCILYAMFGFATMCKQTATQIMNMDIVPLENRVRYLSILALVGLAGMISVPKISTMLQDISGGDFRYLAYTTLILQLITLPVLYKLPDPRKNQQAALT